MTFVVGVDLSLTATGVAAAVGGTAKVRTVTSTPTEDTIAARSIRLRAVAGALFNLARDADLVVIERPAFLSKTGAAHDRSGLWWLLVARLTGAGVPVAEVSPNTIKKYATGKGTADKDAVLAAVVRRYPDVEVNTNNEADALILAALGARHVGEPLEATLPADRLAALSAVKWPPLRGVTGSTGRG